MNLCIILELKNHTRIEDGDAHLKLSFLFWVPVVAGGAEPQEDDGIARAWIIYQCPNDGIHAIPPKKSNI